MPKKTARTVTIVFGFLMGAMVIYLVWPKAQAWTRITLHGPSRFREEVLRSKSAPPAWHTARIEDHGESVYLVTHEKHGSPWTKGIYVFSENSSADYLAGNGVEGIIIWYPGIAWRVEKHRELARAAAPLAP